MPHIEVVVNNLTINEGSSFTIPCKASGYPAPMIIWSRSDGFVSDRVSISDGISVPTGNENVTRVSVNLTITNVSREDAGVYVCQAINCIGSDSNNISVTVQCKFIMLYSCTIVH